MQILKATKPKSVSVFSVTSVPYVLQQRCDWWRPTEAVVWSASVAGDTVMSDIPSEATHEPRSYHVECRPNRPILGNVKSYAEPFAHLNKGAVRVVGPPIKRVVLYDCCRRQINPEYD